MLPFIVPIVTAPFENTSENFRWSAAVASFGMVLRQSEFAGSATWSLIEDWAANAMARNDRGYRKEFIGLIRQLQSNELEAKR